MARLVSTNARTAMALLPLLAGCTLFEPRESADGTETQTPARVACTTSVKEMQGSCSANLLRAGEQGPECSAASERIMRNCQPMQ